MLGNSEHDAPSFVRWAALAALATATLYVAIEIHLWLVVRDSTPSFGELGAHLHEPQYLRDHLLPRLSGWSPSYFGGAPWGTFYFPLAPLVTVILDLLVPYPVAFKLVTAMGMLALPACAYAFGRLFDRDRVTSACLAVSTLPFLLQPTSILGGSISSTVLSEYTYQLSMAAGLLALGMAGRGMRTGRHRALAALLVACTFLLHLLPGAMVVVGIAALALFRPSWPRIRWALEVLAAGGAVGGFSLLPFLLRRPYSAGPVYEKAKPLGDYLFFEPMAPIILLAIAGAISAVLLFIRRREDLGTLLVILAAVAAVAIALIPSGRLWNGRFVPFWYLWTSLLAGFAVGRLGLYLDELREEIAKGREIPLWTMRMAAPFALLFATVVFWDSPVGAGAVIGERFDVSEVAKQAYQGYERGPHRAEDSDFVATVHRLADEHGCGRAHWEWDKDPWVERQEGLATLLPYWTDGCIGSMQGIFTQSAPSARFVSQANARLAKDPRLLDSDQPMPVLDVARGVEDLRLLGVRYYFAATPEAQEQADESAGLRRVAETKPDNGRSWKIYEVDGVELVEALSAQPVVVPGASEDPDSWIDVASPWFERADRAEVFLADGGPSQWTRLKRASADLPNEPVAPTAVLDVRFRGEQISFRVSKPGTPILVKASHFPNWKASGAKGPWRVTPNYMVVVPTAERVTLRYRQTAVENLGWLITLAGVVAVVLLGRAKSLVMPEPIQEAVPVAPPPRAAQRKKPKKSKKKGR